MKPKVIHKGVGGLTVWEVPDTKLQILWAGPGARLLIGQPMVSAGAVTLIEHPTADGIYDTRKDAEAAVAAFLEAKA